MHQSQINGVTGRIDYLDIAKAICIFLVVAGHFNPVPSPDGWNGLIKVIYSFHMPLFMFASGFLFSKRYRRQPYLEFISKKFRRLMIPYFLTSIFIIGIKLLMQNVMFVKNTVGVNDFLTMFYKPSAAIHLWFIWALMLNYLIAPLCRKKWAASTYLAAAIVLYLLPVTLPDIFSLNQFKANAVFFAAGIVTDVFEIQPYIEKRFSPIIVLVFAILEYLFLNGAAPGIMNIILPFAGILFILTVSALLSDLMRGRTRSAILFTGRNTLIIFLLHSAFGEFGKAALSFAGITPANHFLLTLAAFFLMGICAPLLLKIIWVKIRNFAKSVS